MVSQPENHYYCRALIGVLGMYEHSDAVSGGEPVITVFFPQDTANDYPGCTLVHELTHRDLVDGSLTGGLQLLLGTADKLENCPGAHRQVFRTVMETSVGRSRFTHEAVATYLGLIHQATEDQAGVERIYRNLPPYYSSALSALETVLPKCTDLSRGIPHLYRNIALALGKFALNTSTVERLLNISNPSLEKLVATVKEDSPDALFQRILQQLAADPRILLSMLDIVRKAPLEAGFASFEAFLEGAREMPRDALMSLIFTMDQQLMGRLSTVFGTMASTTPDASRRIDLLNNLIGTWNAAFQERYGHKFAAVDGIEMQMNARPRIRTVPSPPEVASGKRTGSRMVSPMIGPGDIVNGLSVAKGLGLWLHARMFINPGDKVLSLGPTAPPLKARCAVLFFQPCIPDTIRTDEERRRLLELMERSPIFCRTSTSLYIENRRLPELIGRLAGVTLLWHVDWIMYNYAAAAGIKVDELPGHKYIHMDNADDVTFLEWLEHLGATSDTEGYVQRFGNETLLVATFHRVGGNVFYSMPIPEYKYSEFTDRLSSIRGRFLKDEDFQTQPFRYRNNMALLFHYGV